MKMRIGFVFVLMFSVLGVVCGQKADSSNSTKYTRTILNERKLKDKELKSDAASPLTNEDKLDFTGLNYFRPKKKYVKRAILTRFDNPTVFKMKTTTDRLPDYSIWGKVEFEHKGKKYQLNVYRNIDLSKRPGFENYLFIPFNDATNGKQTYGGGRFLDAKDTGLDFLILDFNKAYNPYCAYNHKYSCPIPPEENDLPIKVKAGELKFH